MTLFLKKIFLINTFILFTFSISAQLLVENFDYSVGTVLTATASADLSTGWLAHSGNGTANIDVTNGLSFTGYAGSEIGGAANLDANGQDINKPFTPQSSGTLYAAFLIQTGATNNLGYFLHLGPATMSSTFFSRLWVNATGTGIGITNGSTAPSNWITINSGAPVLIVIKHDFSTNISNLYVLNSFVLTEPSSPDVTLGETISEIGTIGLRQYNASEKVIVDGIRIGTNWADAVAPKLVACNPSNLSFTNSSVNKVIGDPLFTITPTSLNGTTPITFSNDNTGVATVNSSTGEITILAAGTTTITASQDAGTNNSVSYCAATTSYTLNVGSNLPTIIVTDVTDIVMNSGIGSTVTQDVSVNGVNLTDNIEISISNDTTEQFDEPSITSINKLSDNTASGIVTITYRPTISGMHTAVLNVMTNGAVTQSQTITGIGTDPTNPYNLDISSPLSEINETFEGVAVGKSLPTGWKNVTIKGSNSWEIKTYNSNQYAQMSAYGGTGEQQTLLISPAIDFDKVLKSNIAFDWLAGYAKSGTTLKVYEMTLNGNKTEIKTIDTATPASGYDVTYTTESIDLSAYNGIAFLVFEYNGNSTDLTTTYQVDNVIVPMSPISAVNQSKSDFKIKVINQNIVFNSNAGENVIVYNSVGQKLIVMKTVEGVNSISVSSRGVVLVTIGDLIFKVMLK